MPIVVNVDVMLARRKMTSAELAEKIKKVREAIEA